jgi:hypothetical protein
MKENADHKTHSVTDVLLALEDIDLEDKTLFPIKPKDLIMWDEDAEVIKPAFEGLLDLYFKYDVVGENTAYKIEAVLDRRL